MNRPRRLALLLAAGALAIAVAWWWQGRSAERPIAARGGAELSLSVPYHAVKQGDPRWRSLPLGSPPGGAMGGSGCTIACLSMALDSLGFPVDPLTLVQRLQAEGGFTSDGLVVWAVVEKAYPIDVSLAPPSYDAIDAALRADRPVLTKVRLHGSGPVHWVLVTGKRGDEYLASDPLAGESVPLSSFASPILATRIIRRR